MRGSGASGSRMRLVPETARPFSQIRPLRRAMIPHRQWMAVCFAGLCWGGFAVAQEGGGGAASGAGGGNAGAGAQSSGADAGGTGGTAPAGAKSGAKSTDSTADTTPGTTPADGTTPGGTPAPKTGGSVDPFIPTTPKTDKPAGTDATGASSSFGTNGGSGDATAKKPRDTDATQAGPTGPSSSFGTGDATATQKAAPPSFTLPGFFGGPSTTYTGGQGRLARPRFRYKVTISQGYDDNVLQTPDHPQRAADQQVLVSPGTPDTVTFVPVTTTTYEQAFAGPIVYLRPVTTTTFERRVTKGTAPVIQTIKAPEPQQRAGSFVSRLGLQFDAQQATRRSVFTLDLNGSVDHYWYRPGSTGSDDYSGAVALAYLYNLTPRLQASLTANIAYLSQPDFTRINTPDRIGGGDLVNALARLNLMYRVTPRLSTTFSVGENGIYYVKKNSSTTGASNNGDSYETTFSAEARYLWKPRYTLLTEFRHVLISYPKTPSVDARTELLLVGGELRLNSRLSATVRLGESIRIFDQTGDTSSAPYGEATLSYRISPTSSAQWNSRFGYEEPSSAASKVLSYRTTLNYSKNFTPRLSLSAGITGVSRNTSVTGGSSQSEQTIDANIAIEYHLSRQLTLNTTFSFTKIITTSGELDYDRSRIFIGGEYEF